MNYTFKINKPLEIGKWKEIKKGSKNYELYFYNKYRYS